VRFGKTVIEWGVGMEGWVRMVWNLNGMVWEDCDRKGVGMEGWARMGWNLKGMVLEDWDRMGRGNGRLG
jgi:hypothetical protein